MDIKKLLFWGILLAGGYYFLKKKGMLPKLSGVCPSCDGLGTGGQPRAGNPKSEAERQVTHKARFGEDLLPDRGAGLKKRF